MAELKISVITAVYNSRATVAAAHASVLEQSHGDIELVVIDGGSTDGTLEVLRGYADRISVLVSEPDHGIYDALNKGIARASGEVVGFLHADDVFAGQNALSRIAAAFSDQGVCAAYGDLQYVRKDDPSRVVRHWASSPFTPRKLAWGWMPPHPTLYVRREWYGRIGGFDTRYRIAADYDCVLRLFSRPDFNAVYIPEVLVKMRLGGASNRSLKNIVRKSREDLDALRRSGIGALGGVGALAWKNLNKLLQFSVR